MNALLKNWDVRRALYFMGGLFFVLVALNDRSWWMIPFGLYFIAMALFRSGCAAGNCNVPFSEEDSEIKN